MTITPSSDFIGNALAALAGRVRTLQAQRAQRIALASLLAMDRHRLDDLGLSVHDVTRALEGRLHRG